MDSRVDMKDLLASDIKPIPLRSINAAMSYLPVIEAANKQVIAEMESMVMSGLATVVCIFLILPECKKMFR